jgi:KAP family P-loop domain
MPLHREGDVVADEETLGQVRDFKTMPLRDDNPSRIDLLGFDDVVAAVGSTVTRQDLDPITVGVNAPWGGGKTTVLRLLRKLLAARDDVLVIYVSPWEYDRTTDTKAALIGAVLGRLEGEIRGDQTAMDTVRQRLSELRERINITKAVKLAATSALTMSLPSIKDLASLFDDRGTQAADPTLQGFRGQFEELLSSDALGHVSRVIVLVDDLDRSLPDKVVETLEAIKLFLSVDKMAFVVAADEDNVARAIGRQLESTGQPTTARQYLEKIVQIPFRIPALSRERTEEYLALLMLGDVAEVDALVDRVAGTRRDAGSLAARLDGLVPEARRADVDLAERLAPILHRHTQGNPRRLKRFLNALWLRTAFAGSRGVELKPDACAKLMVAELLYPDLFAQMLGWLASGTLADDIADIEDGRGEHAEQAFEWGRLQPSLATVDLASYLLLAASLRGDTVEEAALPPELREPARELTADSTAVRDGALKKAAAMDTSQRSVLARHVASQLRHQRTPERQKALAESLSGLANEAAVAMTAAEELALMNPSTVLSPVPFSLLAKHQPAELIAVIRRWTADAEVQERTRQAAVEALKGVG